jgi:hypothetical protein
MFDLITIGKISLFGIVGALAYTLINKFADRSSERHMRTEKETEESLHELKAAFNLFLLELDKTNFMSISLINTEIRKQDSAIQKFSIRINGRSLSTFNAKYAEYKKKIEEYTNICLEATARVMKGLSLDAPTEKIRKELHNLIDELFKIAGGLK